ncbi:mCG147378 [Mus musculus]|nr:mCG147378 [Mus musculus]
MWLLLVNIPGRGNFRVGEPLLSGLSKYLSPWKQWWLGTLRSPHLYFILIFKGNNLQQGPF